MNQPLFFTRAYWTLFTLEAIAAVALLLWASRSTRSWGPEGQVGAWLIYVVPPVFLAIPLAVVLIGRSPYTTKIGFLILALPLIPLIVGPIYSAINNRWIDHRVAGDFTFLRPAQRQLAHSLSAHNVEQVKALLPAAGDLNEAHQGESLFGFALRNADKSAASCEIIQAILDAGARPDGSLTFGISYGPRMTELLLKAGANPNLLDSSGRPVWWDVLYDGSPEGLQTLTILVDHGANLALRDANGGPVGWAAYQKNWRAVWLMMQRGAAWKDETALGQPIPGILNDDLDYRRHSHMEVPEEMVQILARYGGEGRGR
jgi:hypothetical protein